MITREYILHMKGEFFYKCWWNVYFSIVC